MSIGKSPADGCDGKQGVDRLYDVRIPTADRSITLSADLHLPLRNNVVPALVTVLPYRKDSVAGIFNEAVMRWFSQRGYACVLVDLQGTGSSDGARRPLFDPAEGDDAIAAIEWASEQSWCNGNVGMWGLSYGSMISMRAATRQPRQLKAIIPIMGALDPERDFVHPEGARGDLAPLAVWGLVKLIYQLLPPLRGDKSTREYGRWRRRLHDVEPAMMEIARHRPGDPSWRNRVIDASRITVPSLCVAGWRDVVCDAQIRAYEQMAGPKKLLVGPWMHTLPHDSPFEAIDFLSLALRWWDHWLLGTDNGVMDEPPVTVYMQGSEPYWRTYSSWPPAKSDLLLVTGSDTTLGEAETGLAHRKVVIAEYHSDPTVGTLSGLWGTSAASGLPLDQHEDDTRCLSATSEPLPERVNIVGRPEITVKLVDKGHHHANPPERIVVRLTEVDPQGRSALIAMGLVCPIGPSDTHQIVLSPTAYSICSGNRLRVGISDADFPRLTPLATASSMEVVGIQLLVPTTPDEKDAVVDMPTVENTESQEEPGLIRWSEPYWSITREPLVGRISVNFGSGFVAQTPDREHLLEWSSDVNAIVSRASPGAAVTNAKCAATVKTGNGELITVTSNVRCSRGALWARGEVSVDGTVYFCRTWQAALD